MNHVVLKFETKNSTNCPTMRARVFVRRLAATSVVTGIPFVFYVSLFNLRLEGRIPLVSREQLPPHLAKAPVAGDAPKINFTEGFYADVPVRKLHTENKSRIQDVAQVFWSSYPLYYEWKLLGFLSSLGLTPFPIQEMPKDGDITEPNLSKDSHLLGGTFKVVQGVEDESTEMVVAHYGKSCEPISGYHTIACTPHPENKHLLRVWFVSHVSMHHIPCAELKDEWPETETTWTKYWGHDPMVVDPANPGVPVLTAWWQCLFWFHRLYSRLLVDCMARNLYLRKY